MGRVWFRDLCKLRCGWGIGRGRGQQPAGGAR
jgi:hypothetical protein